MTILRALDLYYDRMAGRGEAEPPGFSREKIGFAILISPEGQPVDVLDLRVQSDRKLQPKQVEVPAAVKRTAGISPNLFWDKTSYVLGRTAGEGKRAAEEHAAFKAAQFELIGETEDEGLLALKSFLQQWSPDRFDSAPFVAEMLDTNVVFKLDGDLGYIHQREPAKRLVEARVAGDGPVGFCLVTGVHASTRRLHPTIKGVDGAQSSGAALVSFNLDAFGSYGKEQGANAPTSEAAAFRYGAALNRLLDRNAAFRNRIKIGDATVAFWADASGVGEPAAAASEAIFAFLVEPPSDAGEAAKVGDLLEIVRKGRPALSLHPDLAPGTRFHVLGLAPNAARLSVRFWLSDRFEVFAERLAEHYRDIEIEPAPWKTLPSVQRLLVRTTALLQKFENIPPLLAGETTRAVLDGGRLTLYLLARLSLWRTARLALGFVLGDWRRLPGLERHVVTDLTIDAGRKALRVMNDGEVQLIPTPLHYRIRPRALAVIVPRDPVPQD